MSRENTQAAARRWVMKLSEDTSVETRAEHQSWLDAHPSHAEAYRACSRVWNAIGDMHHLAHLAQPKARVSLKATLISRVSDFVESMNERLRLGRPVWTAAAVIAVMGAILIGLGFMRRVMGTGVVYTTAVAEIRNVGLTDGSQVTLSARSTIEPQFASAERRVLLREGEAIFDVAADPKRPFVVLTEGVQVRAIGTRFEVHRGTEQVRVSVLQGVVEIAPTAPGAEPVRLAAGEQIITTSQGLKEEIRQVNTSEVAPWRSGTLRYTDSSLAEVIADANRYYLGRIELSEPSLGSLRVTASFGTSQIGQFIDSLEGVLPVRVKHITRDHIEVLPTDAFKEEAIR